MLYEPSNMNIDQQYQVEWLKDNLRAELEEYERLKRLPVCYIIDIFSFLIVLLETERTGHTILLQF